MIQPVSVLLLLSCTVATAQGPKVNRGSLVIQDFNRRVTEYVKLHKTAQSEIQKLKPTNSPEAMKDHEQGLASRIQQERRGVGPGNIFSREIEQEFRRLIAITMHGSEAGRIRESMLRAAPVRPRTLVVNSAYPVKLPLQSTPPSLLLNLPHLPPEVEYRVVGRDLVLRDLDANLIVDLIADVID